MPIDHKWPAEVAYDADVYLWWIKEALDHQALLNYPVRSSTRRAELKPFRRFTFSSLILAPLP